MEEIYPRIEEKGVGAGKQEPRDWGDDANTNDVNTDMIAEKYIWWKIRNNWAKNRVIVVGHAIGRESIVRRTGLKRKNGIKGINNTVVKEGTDGKIGTVERENMGK